MFLGLRRAQSGLEYIILIGGVVILSAASYFLMKGFLISGGDSTQSTMVRGTEVSKEDLLNLGLEPVVFPWARWYSVGSRFKTNFTLSNQGSVALRTNVSLKKAVFESSGVDTGGFEIGSVDRETGEYFSLSFWENSTDFMFESPLIPAGGSVEIVLHYNNSSPYTPVTSFDYSVDDSNVVLGDVGSVEKADFVAPVFGGVVVGTPSAGVGETVSFSVPVNESGLVSGASYLVNVSSVSGSFSTTVFDADGLYHLLGGLPGGSFQVRGSFSGGGFWFDFLPQVAGNYSFSCAVVDEWGNVGSGVVLLNVSGSGTGVSQTSSVTVLKEWRMFRFDLGNSGAPDYGSEVVVSSASWPKSTGGDVGPSPSVADLDGNPSNGLEVVVGSVDNSVYAWHADGSVVSGWPKATSGVVYSSPAVADLDGNPLNGLEVVVGSYDNNVYAWHADGSSVSGWPKATGAGVDSCPSVADLDGNPLNGLEVVVGSQDDSVYAWHADGSSVSGWPKVTGGFVVSGPALVDLDGNLGNGLEVVVGSFDNNVYAWHADGSSVSGWPKTTGDYVSSSPSVVDLDNNPGNGLEVVVGSFDNNVYAWHADGSSVSGWPKTTGDGVFSSPSVADLDQNGDLEVVVGSRDDNVYAWHADGSVVSGWPKATGGDVSSSPGVVDLDGSSLNGLEVVVGSADSSVYAWHADGSVVSGWPQATGSYVYSSPALVDLDGNLGNGLEVVVGSYDNNVYAWHADGTIFT